MRIFLVNGMNNSNYKRFLDAVKLAYELVEQTGTQWIYGHVNNTIFISLHQVRQGWLFKLYPGGRKMLSSEGVNLLKSWGINPDDFNQK